MHTAAAPQGVTSEAMDVERLSIVRFEEELRRAARGRLSLVGNPLDAVVKKIEKNPALAQCRLLTRVLAALVFQKGDFRRAELAAFDAETLATVIALMDARVAGTVAREQWLSALDAVRVAPSAQ